MTPRERTARRGHPVVYLHVGEPKSGTTFLQDVMWGNRTVLARHGLVLPGMSGQDHFRAVADLREVPQPRDDPAGSYRGEWNVLAKQALRAEHASVISHELLAAATPAQVARAIGSLRGAEVHIILTVRDFASLLPAEWQETVKHGHTARWQHWVRHIMRTADAEPALRWFWRVHDTLTVLRRWSQELPPGQVHVVTLPPAGSPPDVLWVRFASVIGVDSADVELSMARPNTSLGLPEAELLRRINVAIAGDHVPDWFYAVRIKERIGHQVLATRASTLRPRLTEGQASWARGRAKKVIADLHETGYHIVGSLDDLLPRAEALAAPTRDRPDQIHPKAMLDAAIDVLAAVLRSEYAPEGGVGPADTIALRVLATARLKRGLRNLSSRHPRLAGLRVVVWPWFERVRRKRRAE